MWEKFESNVPVCFGVVDQFIRQSLCRHNKGPSTNYQSLSRIYAWFHFMNINKIKSKRSFFCLIYFTYLLTYLFIIFLFWILECHKLKFQPRKILIYLVWLYSLCGYPIEFIQCVYRLYVYCCRLMQIFQFSRRD